MATLCKALRRQLKSSVGGLRGFPTGAEGFLESRKTVRFQSASFVAKIRPTHDIP